MGIAWIIDGYVDEPACLGVPPYISPYIRNIAGVLKEHEFTVNYTTIDEIRSDFTLIPNINKSEIVVMIAGVTVPGKYLGGTPVIDHELLQIGSALTFPETFLLGPVQFGFSKQGGKHAESGSTFNFKHLLIGSPSSALDNALSGRYPDGRHSYKDDNRWAVLGADIICSHPSFPNVICELETARGCARSYIGGCSFCTEPFYGKPKFRDPDSVAKEVSALYNVGARHFRLGRQPDLLTYGASGAEYPKPVPGNIEYLFSAIHDAAPNLKTLHIDNINPGTIARYPEESRVALQEIVKGHTAGDVAAFGVESVDPAVIAANNLKADANQVMQAIEIVNDVGAVRDRMNGVPHLLPGLNFICGLSNETELTYQLNQKFLEDVLASGLLVRRVNIRQLMPFEGTPAWNNNALPVSKAFHEFKEWTRKQFDLPMLKKVFPKGTVLSSVLIEKSGDLSFGRQFGSYPILNGIPLNLDEGTLIDVIVVDHGMRSITSLPYPVPVNSLPPKTVRWIPGISKKGVVNVLAKRPFTSVSDFKKLSGTDLPDEVFTLL